jgi:hypothetical protein
VGEGQGEAAGGIVEGAGRGEAAAGEEGLVGELVAVFGVNGFELGEWDSLAGDVDDLGDEAFEVHLDAAFVAVPAGAVDEGVEVEVGVEVAVEAAEDVEVEVGGDAGCVVVGGQDGGDGLVGAGGEVGAEEEGVAGLEVGAEAAEDGVGFLRREVADAGADVEGEDASPGVGAGGKMLEGVGLGNVVGYLGLDLEAGDVGSEAFGGFEGGGADVEWLVEEVGLEAGGGLEEEARLGGAAGA